MIARGDLVRMDRHDAQGVVTAIHTNYDGAPNGIARVYVLDAGRSFIRPGTVVDVGTAALSPTSRVDVHNRRDGIAYLTNDGNDGGLLCFSHYGRNTSTCAPVAWRVAYITARETGTDITTDDLDHAMSLVVNDHDDVSYMVREYGHGMYR